MAVRKLSKSNILDGVKFNRLNQFSTYLEYLIIAGGGGGGKGLTGAANGHGAGAGGYILNSTFFDLGVNYTVTVGAGGTGVTTAVNGSNSVFSDNTAFGGGKGAGDAGVGGNGGSGGGGLEAPQNSFGLAIFNQGNNGGTAPVGSGAGGGGAGTTGKSIAPRGGGDGLPFIITGTLQYLAGGGGGGVGSGTTGAGGLGGGGNGGSGGVGQAGVANTGGGGGGGSSTSSSNGGSGGSGIVILSYPSNYTISVGAGLTAISNLTVGANNVTTITSGTGRISWA